MSLRKRRITPVFTELNRSGRQSLREWYRIYALCFPDESEREEEAEFLNILNMNDDADLQVNLGPWKEAIFAIRDGQTGKIVGGLNFGMTFERPEREKAASSRFAATVQVPYLFIDPAYRNEGHPDIVVLVARPVLTAIRNWVDDKLAEAGIDAKKKEILLFFEANDPTRMTLAQRRDDKANAQIDPWLRYALWVKYAQPLNFAYVQPPLHPSKKPVKYLDLFCMALGPSKAPEFRRRIKSIPAVILREHLCKFFSISVLKGEDANQNLYFIKQRNLLDEYAESNVPVSFLEECDDKVRDIKEQANTNVKIAVDARRAWSLLPSLGTYNTTAKARLDSVAPQLSGPTSMLIRLAGRAYNLAYFFSRRAERLEGKRQILDFAIAAIGIVATGALLFGFIKDIDWFDKASIPSLFVALLYGGLRILVWCRRRQLGEPAKRLWRNVQRTLKISAGEDGENGAHRWLTERLTSELILNFGPLFGANTPISEFDRVLERVLSYSDFYYAESISNYRVASDATDERTSLREAVKDFTQGLWAANWADISLFSVVFPIVPNALQAGSENAVCVDEELAKLILSSGTISNLNRDAHFLVHYTFADIPEIRWRRHQELQIETRLFLLALVHLAYFLENIADAGNLQDGLTRSCKIYWSCPGATLSRILRLYGFEPLRPDSELDGGYETNIGKDKPRSVWRLSIDGLTLDSSEPRARRVQRFVELLHGLLQRRNELLH